MLLSGYHGSFCAFLDLPLNLCLPMLYVHKYFAVFFILLLLCSSVSSFHERISSKSLLLKFRINKQEVKIIMTPYLHQWSRALP